MERAVGGVKWVTTDAIRNWFHNGWEANGFMKGMGHLVWGTGDLAGSAAKLVPFMAEWLAKQPNKFLWNPVIAKTQWWVEAQRLSEVTFWDLNVLGNTDYHPSTPANDNRASQRVAA
jgi:hypothetical protein